jgi:hypothetical protein
MSLLLAPKFPSATKADKLHVPVKQASLLSFLTVHVQDVSLALYFCGTPDTVTLKALKSRVCSSGGSLNSDAFRILVGKPLEKLSLWKFEKGL